MKAFLEISIGEAKPSKLLINLYSETCPRTVLNFTTLLTRKAPNGYLNSKFHRLIPSFMIQGGDFSHGDGTGGKSIYGDSFDDENFEKRHETRGTLSMANSGRNTNGSQFFITFRKTQHLDGKHVVFGSVDMEDAESVRLLKCLEEISVGPNDVPRTNLTIIGGGIIKKQIQKEVEESVAADNDEIDLDDDENEEDSKPAAIEEEEEEEEEPVVNPNSKKGKLQERLRKLKMKMNQSRQLNKKEVLSEGDRLGSKEASDRYRKQTNKQDKQRKDQDLMEVHGKSTIMKNLDKKQKQAMMQSGHESLYRVMKKEETRERTRYSERDYHNPEGQFRQYEINVKSIRAGYLDTSEKDPDDIESEQDKLRERDGAKRLAAEMKRKSEKSERNKRKKQQEFDGEDVSYINKRNKRFNEKIARNYDAHTAEIRQNLERGTAL